MRIKLTGNKFSQAAAWVMKHQKKVVNYIQDIAMKQDGQTHCILLLGEKESYELHDFRGSLLDALLSNKYDGAILLFEFDNDIDSISTYNIYEDRFFKIKYTDIEDALIRFINENIIFQMNVLTGELLKENITEIEQKIKAAYKKNDGKLHKFSFVLMDGELTLLEQVGEPGREIPDADDLVLFLTEFSINKEGKSKHKKNHSRQMQDWKDEIWSQIGFDISVNCAVQCTMMGLQ